MLRSMYPTCNDSYLWDLFKRCNGDADWCANLLFDEDKTDQMDGGSDLTCSCESKDVEKVKKVQQQQASPTMKPKKTKIEAKQISLDELLETKELIEKSITIGQEHYPEHVNKVREWKNIQPRSQTVVPDLVEQGDGFNVPSPTEATEIEERLELTIPVEMIRELDDEYGGGLLRADKEGFVKFPKKILVRTSVAVLLFQVRFWLQDWVKCFWFLIE